MNISEVEDEGTKMVTDMPERNGGEVEPVDRDGTLINQSSTTQSIRDEFKSRLLLANLKTEAVKAGMVDLDGIKLIDLAALDLGVDDEIIGGQQVMDDLKRTKPWLFSMAFSSRVAGIPASQPIRQKTALEMTDEEYALARTTVTKYRF